VRLLLQLVNYANQHHDGHLTIMKFTTNWRVTFGTVVEDYGVAKDSIEMEAGRTLCEAIKHALNDPRAATCITLASHLQV
jgi:hypothetical protein